MCWWLGLKLLYQDRLVSWHAGPGLCIQAHQHNITPIYRIMQRKWENVQNDEFRA